MSHCKAQIDADERSILIDFHLEYAYQVVHKDGVARVYYDSDRWITMWYSHLYQKNRHIDMTTGQMYNSNDF